MDVPLYAIGLILFAVLYLAVGMFLGFVLIITLLVMLLYVGARYGKLPDNYPHGAGDIMITVIFIGVTWGIFVFLGPKNPIPFLPSQGQGVLYGPVLNLAPYIAIALILVTIFLLIGAFVAPQFRDILTRGGVSGGGGGSGDSGKPKQGVGA